MTHHVHIGEETLGKSTSFDTPDAHIVLHYERRREAGNIPLYSATLCTLTGATGLPCPPDLERTAEALFPWVHECANQLGLPIEILGAGTHRRWQALITKDAPACEP